MVKRCQRDHDIRDLPRSNLVFCFEIYVPGFEPLRLVCSIQYVLVKTTDDWPLGLLVGRVIGWLVDWLVPTNEKPQGVHLCNVCVGKLQE